jgi:hypothetical protein
MLGSVRCIQVESHRGSFNGPPALAKRSMTPAPGAQRVLTPGGVTTASGAQLPRRITLPGQLGYRGVAVLTADRVGDQRDCCGCNREQYG